MDKTKLGPEVWESYKDWAEYDFHQYRPELYALSDQVGEFETNILDIYDFIEVLYVNPGCVHNVTKVESPN